MRDNDAKLNLANILLIESVKAGKDVSEKLVHDVFLCVDRFENEAINRDLIAFTHCPKCGREIKYMKAGEGFVTRCTPGCGVAGNGANTKEAGKRHYIEAIKDA